jgi:hypothetical protein
VKRTQRGRHLSPIENKAFRSAVLSEILQIPTSMVGHEAFPRRLQHGPESDSVANGVNRRAKIARRNTNDTLVALDSFLPIGLGFDQVRVDREPFATDQPLPDAAAQESLEHATEEIALAKATVPVLRKRRVIWDSSV